jgi:hypothetical protein
VTRLLLGLAGAAAAAYGALLLLDDGFGDLVDVATWLVSGVVLHDLVLAPLVIVLVVVASRLLPAVWRAPAAAALVVLGSVTLLAIPVLGRFGARADNPTLLDRSYWAGWAMIAGLTVLATAATVLVRARRMRRTGRNPRRRGRSPG